MMKRHIYLLALPLLSIAACLDMSDQDSADGTSSQADTIDIIDNICEVFGPFCVGAPIIDFEAPVLETGSGRTLAIMPVANSPGEFTLAFSADPTKCVAIKNDNTLVEVRACNQLSAIWIPELQGSLRCSRESWDI